MSFFFVSSDLGLMHHGIKGQKWGVRRYQNKDGSLTTLGKARVRGEEQEYDQAIKRREDYYRSHNYRGYETVKNLIKKYGDTPYKDFENSDRLKKLKEEYKKVDALVKEHNEIYDKFWYANQSLIDTGNWTKERERELTKVADKIYDEKYKKPTHRSEEIEKERIYFTGEDTLSAKELTKLRKKKNYDPWEVHAKK